MQTRINKDWRFDISNVDETVDLDVDITFEQLQGMEQQAQTFLDAGRNSTKQERRLAKNLLKSIKWIKREVYNNLRKVAEEDFKATAIDKIPKDTYNIYRR